MILLVHLLFITQNYLLSYSLYKMEMHMYFPPLQIHLLSRIYSAFYLNIHTHTQQLLHRRNLDSGSVIRWHSNSHVL